MERKRKLLCISYRFPPETYPLASRITYMLEALEGEWEIDAITAAEGAKVGEAVTIHHVVKRTPEGLIRWLRRMKMAKLINLLLWPDQYIFWVLPAYRKAMKLIKKGKPDLIVVFMMPYSTGLVGLLLKKKTRLPLVLNLNDSPTCTDMNPSFASRLHFELAHWLEDNFARKSDSIIYVSERNMKRVQMRQAAEHRDKFYLIRRGARVVQRNGIEPPGDRFNIVYTGGMSGWYQFNKNGQQKALIKNLFQAWERFGRYQLVKLDHRSHSPVYLGKAIRRVLEQSPDLTERIAVNIYGNRYPQHVVDQTLEKFGIKDFVHVFPPVAHDEVRRRTLTADLLFMALPERLDGSPGGRISAKTYEYLMTDRPILAAVPEGENREFLQDKPGVYLVSPKDVDAMSQVVGNLIQKKLNGEDLSVDRTDLQPTLTNTSRAQDFMNVLSEVVRQ